MLTALWVVFSFFVSVYVGVIMHVTLVFMTPIVALFFGVIIDGRIFHGNAPLGRFLYNFFTLFAPSIVAATMFVLGMKGWLPGTRKL